MDQNYSQLLTAKRLRESTRGARSIVDESESDKARVLYSAAFRRLQRKTQVFPLEENAAIRSRMTHSLEVAHVGRYLTTTFLEKIGKRNLRDKFGINLECDLAIPNIVETACLLHDIGNPPFGHFGEAAISNWFKSVWQTIKEKKFKDNNEIDILIEDIVNFDGNPQGFRFICRLAGMDEYGMNLTVAQMASTVKYPVLPCDIDKSENPDPLKKKAGIYQSEADIWQSVCESLGMPQGSRFPLAYLMEAADDISYCLSDIEDGIEKGFLRHHDLVRSLIEGVGDNREAKQFIELAAEKAKGSSLQVDETVAFRARLVTYIVDRVSDIYIAKHAEIFDGSSKSLLNPGSPEFAILKALRDTVSRLLYDRRTSNELELTGLAAITGILSHYQCLLELSRDDFSKIFSRKKVSMDFVEHTKLFSLMAPKHIGCYKRLNNNLCNDSQEWINRLHLIVDFVAGMTDVYALKTYQVLSGIRF